MLREPNHPETTAHCHLRRELLTTDDCGYVKGESRSLDDDSEEHETEHIVQVACDCRMHTDAWIWKRMSSARHSAEQEWKPGCGAAVHDLTNHRESRVSRARLGCQWTTPCKVRICPKFKKPTCGRGVSPKAGGIRLQYDTKDTLVHRFPSHPQWKGFTSKLQHVDRIPQPISQRLSLDIQVARITISRHRGTMKSNFRGSRS